jgi:hypothetical protein
MAETNLIPAASPQRRRTLAGLRLADHSDDRLLRE